MVTYHYGRKPIVPDDVPSVIYLFIPARDAKASLNLTNAPARVIDLQGALFYLGTFPQWPLETKHLTT